MDSKVCNIEKNIEDFYNEYTDCNGCSSKKKFKTLLSEQR